jgi:hypothetical protein
VTQQSPEEIPEPPANSVIGSTPAPEGDEFTSDEPMVPSDPSQPLVQKLPTPHEKAQQGIGKLIVGTAMVAYLLVLLFHLLDLTNTSDGLGTTVTYIVSGLQTLTAAVIGFYFGTREKD